jgi:hypothetical protein
MAGGHLALVGGYAYHAALVLVQLRTRARTCRSDARDLPIPFPLSSRAQRARSSRDMGGLLAGALRLTYGRACQGYMRAEEKA